MIFKGTTNRTERKKKESTVKKTTGHGSGCPLFA